MIKLKPTYIAALLAFSSTASNAAELNIEIQNLTHGIYFTPIAAVVHTPETSLFEVGEAASTELQMMAEGGSLDGLRPLQRLSMLMYWLTLLVDCWRRRLKLRVP